MPLLQQSPQLVKKKKIYMRCIDAENGFNDVHMLCFRGPSASAIAFLLVVRYVGRWWEFAPLSSNVFFLKLFQEKRRRYTFADRCRPSLLLDRFFFPSPCARETYMYLLTLHLLPPPQRICKSCSLSVATCGLCRWGHLTATTKNIYHPAAADTVTFHFSTAY